MLLDVFKDVLKMSSPKDLKIKKSIKPPLRPKGVREADEERTGFHTFNPNEKDPLIELFDTLQTVKEKTEQYKEHSEPVNPLYTHIESSEKSKNNFFTWPKAVSVFIFFSICVFAVIKFSGNNQSNTDLAKQKEVRAPAQSDTSHSTPSISKQTQAKKTVTSKLKQQEPTPKPVTKIKTPQFAPQPTQPKAKPLQRNARTRKLPARQKLGSFFPTEDPGGYDDEEDYYEDEAAYPENRAESREQRKDDDYYRDEKDYYADEYDSGYEEENIYLDEAQPEKRRNPRRFPSSRQKDLPHY